MSQLIDLSNFNKPTEQSEITTLGDYQYENKDLIPQNPLSVSDSLELLKEMFPSKVFFSIAEVASITNVSYEFIRAKISNGIIPTTSMGNRKFINIITLNKLLSEGI